MAREEIVLGPPPRGEGGDTPRAASIKINAMTKELYGLFDKVDDLMDRTVTATSVTYRFFSGLMICTLNLNNLPVGANTSATVSQALPARFLNWAEAAVTARYGLSVSDDHYGLITGYLSLSGDSVTLRFRNGATPQSFTNIRATITGNWK